MADETKAVTLLEHFNQWMQAQGLKPDEQFFDNRPPRMLDAFPAIGSQGVNEAFLSQRLWWWRRANPEQCHQVFHYEGVPEWSIILLDLFKERFELSAWMYEFHARYKERYLWGFGPPWIGCSQEQRRMLGCLWPQSEWAKQLLPSDKNDPLFQALTLHVNLRLSDGILVDQFIEAIERLRRIHGAPRSGKGHGGQRRERSWRPLEILDKRHYGLPTDESERSQLSKAIRAYERGCADSGVSH